MSPTDNTVSNRGRRPKISVIVPVFNSEKYIEKCTASILNQTIQDFELILVDDGSQDESGYMCDRIAQTDKRVHVIHQKNNGVSAARNTGLDTAKGEYVCFTDADDWVEPRYLEMLLRNMTPKGFSAADLVRDDTPPREEKHVKRLDREQAQFSVLSSKGIHGWPVARLFDADLLRIRCIRFDPEISQCEDELFCMEYLRCMEGMAYVSDGAMYHYRTNPMGALQRRYRADRPEKRNFSEILAAERMEKYIDRDGPVYTAWQQRRDKAAAATLRLMVACGYTNDKEIKRLKKIVRYGCLRYLFGDVGALSSKMSMLLSAISPELEWAVFKRISLR